MGRLGASVGVVTKSKMANVKVSTRAKPATVWREKSMGREISDARGREETSVQLANRNRSESEKFVLAFSTPTEKSVRFGRLTNQ